MLFNSIAFGIFLPIVFGLYWAIPAVHRRLRNGVLLVASYVFYGYWDPRFLSLIAMSTALDYAVGRALGREGDRRRRSWLLAASLIFNLGMLGAFKYYGFFADSLREAMSALGVSLSLPVLRVVLPVGISFYTFQTLSYTIDVYRKRIPACRDPIAFATFVAFFPQLVAGPIERAASLLPQFEGGTTFEPAKARDGARQMLWGFFKKLVIADNAAPWVDTIFAAPSTQSGLELVVGAVLFSLQIYADFSGYSDIAIGTARLFGFDLMTNFRVPYFSRNVGEFWRRWHISLSTWFRDYVYVPLGGSRVSGGRVARNVLVVFVLSGLWHGANWTFLAWGTFHAACFMPSLLLGRNRRFTDAIAQGRALPSVGELGHILLTYAAVCIGWVFFRAQSIGAAFDYLGKMVNPSGWFGLPASSLVLEWLIYGVLVAFMVVIEWIHREQRHGLAVASLRTWTRWVWYQIVLMLILFFGAFSEQQFIYFQF